MPIDPYIGAVQWVSFNFAPRGWALCNGQLLAVAQNQALFSLLGTQYGGNGTTTFALPNLQGRTPVGQGPTTVIGQELGAEVHTLQVSEIPPHVHTVGLSDARATTATPGASGAVPAGGSRAFADRELPMAHMSPDAVSPAGGSIPHPNMQPYLTLNAIIALEGIYPARN